MKKNLVFVIPSLNAGGAEKSLVNLLNVIDYTIYNVDLLLLYKSGIFLNMIPKQVNIIEMSADFKIFSNTLIKSVILSLRSGNFKLAFHRLLFALNNNFIKNEAIAEQRSWRNLQNAIPQFNKRYDVAVAFLEKTSIYIVSEKFKALKKIGFIHNDYSQLRLDKTLDTPYLKKLNNIITVSEKCSVVLKKTFPELSSKVNVIYNIVSPRLIKELAEKGRAKEISDNHITILSIGRLHHQKGFDLAIEACKILIQNGFKIKWYIIGDGSERKRLSNKITKLKLENHFILLGLKENPYPYIKKVSIYCQTSIFEGKSIAIDEAKILNKVIVTTNFTTVKDQIEHKVNGIITEINAIDIAKKLMDIIHNKKLQNELILNLSNENLGTEAEIQKLYKIIDKID